MFAISIWDGWAERWTATMIAFLWQSTLLIVLASVMICMWRRSSPAVRYWLWQIVAIKLLLMPFWSFYVPAPTWMTDRPAKSLWRSVPSVGDVDETEPLGFPSRLTIGGSASAAVPRVLSFWERCAAITWKSWLLSVWCLGVAWQLARLLWQRFRLTRLLSRSISADVQTIRLVGELAEEMGIRRTPEAVSVADDCPMFVCGWRRPQLVLPERLLATLDPVAVRQVILHELAHVKRHDLFWGWPVEIARIVYFFHPLVYWVSHQLRLERELCCDQLAMAYSGQPAADYARTLVQVVRHVSEST
jgi:beta-lactamase regulating signal transducer with metallopeptidase domain